MVDTIRKFVSVPYNNILPEMGNIQGPILNPVWMEPDVIYKLLLHRRPVYEHDVSNLTNRIKLTFDNWDDYTLFEGNTQIEDPSLKPNTYIVSIKDGVNEDDMAPGYLYIEIM